MSIASKRMVDPDDQEDALSIFNKAWNEKLNIKRAAEAAQEKVVREQAHDDRLGWATQRDIRLNARKDSNRCQEQVLLETLEADIDASNVWDGISKFIDISNDIVDVKSSDISRMKKLLIQLKNQTVETPRATSLI